MDKQLLFYAIKLMFLAVILAEAATLKMILVPESYFEFIHITALFYTYIEHIVLSILFLGLGALIFLAKV